MYFLKFVVFSCVMWHRCKQIRYGSDMSFTISLPFYQSRIHV